MREANEGVKSEVPQNEGLRERVTERKIHEFGQPTRKEIRERGGLENDSDGRRKPSWLSIGYCHCRLSSPPAQAPHWAPIVENGGFTPPPSVGGERSRPGIGPPIERGGRPGLCRVIARNDGREGVDVTPLEWWRHRQPNLL